MSRHVLSVALTSIVLAGCLPAAEKYQRIEATGARYFHSICQGGYGAQSVVYYPYHGIFISLSISNHIALGLHLPEGMTAQLNEEVVHISGFTESGPVDESFPLRAVPQGALGTINPPEFVGLRDPFLSPLNFGPLAGVTERGRYIWYLFIAETVSEPRRIMSPPNGLLRGTVQLPSMTINGELYEPQTLQFERQTYIGAYPVNC